MSADFAWNSRKIIRILFESEAYIRLHRSSKKDIQFTKKTVPVKLIDVSLGGCALEGSSFVPAGIKINIFLDRSLLAAPGNKTGKKNYTRIMGVVKNSRQLPNRKYRMGIQFEKLSPNDLKIVKDFVERNERRDEGRIPFPKK